MGRCAVYTLPYHLKPAPLALVPPAEPYSFRTTIHDLARESMVQLLETALSLQAQLARKDARIAELEAALAEQRVPAGEVLQAAAHAPDGLDAYARPR